MEMGRNGVVFKPIAFECCRHLGFPTPTPLATNGATQGKTLAPGGREGVRIEWCLKRGAGIGEGSGKVKPEVSLNRMPQESHSPMVKGGAHKALAYPLIHDPFHD